MQFLSFWVNTYRTPIVTLFRNSIKFKSISFCGGHKMYGFFHTSSTFLFFSYIFIIPLLIFVAFSDSLVNVVHFLIFGILRCLLKTWFKPTFANSNFFVFPLELQAFRGNVWIQNFEISYHPRISNIWKCFGWFTCTIFFLIVALLVNEYQSITLFSVIAKICCKLLNDLHQSSILLCKKMENEKRNGTRKIYPLAHLGCSESIL